MANVTLLGAASAHRPATPHASRWAGERLGDEAITNRFRQKGGKLGRPQRAGALGTTMPGHGER